MIDGLTCVQHWKDSPLSKEVAQGAPAYDIIILAEVFSIPDLHPELVWTVKQFCHKDVIIWSMFMNRPFSFMFFVHVADSGGFRVHQFSEEEYDVCGLDTEVSPALNVRVLTYMCATLRFALAGHARSNIIIHAPLRETCSARLTAGISWCALISDLSALTRTDSNATRMFTVCCTERRSIRSRPACWLQRRAHHEVEYKTTAESSSNGRRARALATFRLLLA